MINRMYDNIIKPVFYLILIILVVEFVFLAIYRNYRRQTTYQQAVQKSKQINKPLIVIGSPSAGFMNSIYPVYGCGDICVDLVGCQGCKVSIKDNFINVLKKLSDNSSVVFESCVLEVLSKSEKQLALSEIKRVTKDNYFQVRISPTIFVNLINNMPFIRDGIHNIHNTNKNK